MVQTTSCTPAVKTISAKEVDVPPETPSSVYVIVKSSEASQLSTKSVGSNSVPSTV